MVVKLSKLGRFVSDCIKEVQAARADVMATDNIQTDPFDIAFQINVIDDTQPEIEAGATEQITPETTQTTTRKPTTQTQTQEKPEVISKEKQISEPGLETNIQIFGRENETTAEYTE